MSKLRRKVEYAISNKLSILDKLNKYFHDKCLFTNNTFAQDMFINYCNVRENKIFMHCIIGNEVKILVLENELFDKYNTELFYQKCNFLKLYEDLENGERILLKTADIISADESLWLKTKGKNIYQLVKRYLYDEDQLDNVYDIVTIDTEKIYKLHNDLIEDNEKLVEYFNSFEYKINEDTIAITKEFLLSQMVELVFSRQLHLVCETNSQLYNDMFALAWYHGNI